MSTIIEISSFIKKDDIEVDFFINEEMIFCNYGIAVREIKILVGSIVKNLSRKILDILSIGYEKDTLIFSYCIDSNSSIKNYNVTVSYGDLLNNIFNINKEAFTKTNDDISIFTKKVIEKILEDLILMDISCEELLITDRLQ